MSTRAPIALLVTFAALAGCGPNYRYVYDGESAFERCYGLDYDTTAADGARVSCWSTWLQSYSYGANPDRVDFARNRLAALGAGDRRDAAAPSSGANTASLNPSAVPGAAAPASAPTAALTVGGERPSVRPDAPANGTPAPSPWSGRISTGGNPVNAPPPTQHDDTGAEPPGASCAHDCRAAWSAAAARCPRQDAACVARSDEAYRECMRGCF
jgi:hypothetical protein